MTRPALCVLLLLCAAPVLSAAPPDAPSTLAVAPGGIAEVVVKVPAGKEVGYKLVSPPGTSAPLFRELKADAPGERVFWFSSQSGGNFSVVWWTKGETTGAVTAIAVGAAPPPGPPVPPGPGPKPPEPPPPAPLPVTSFRVALVFESGPDKVLPPKQSAAMFARSVEEYLDANCTGGRAGWRRRDRDVVAVGDDTAEFKAFWDKARPQSQAAPCVTFEVNGKVLPAEPLPADTAALLALLKSKKEGR